MAACFVAEIQSEQKSRRVRVSILTLTYNRPQFIGRAIESVLNQDFQDWELIVVHDGPDERTAEIVSRWGNSDPRIRYLRREKAGNIANATNYGLAHVRGEYVAILDDDDSWIPAHKLSKQVQFLDGNPDYAACGGGMIVVDRSGQKKLRCLKRQDDAGLKRWALVANPIVHSTAMFRRSLMESCGGYDESLSGFADWDVVLKLGQCGKLYNFPEEFTSYTLWDDGWSFAQHRKSARSALTIIRRYANAYRGFLPAVATAAFQYAYAHLPEPIRQLSFSFLSRTKKALFSERRKRRAEPVESAVEPAEIAV
ncbi:MAG: glycosyltransferase family 2 protein [Bryobacteraceae bacterium]